MSKLITISIEEYEELQDRSEFLSCLEACGVDNWSGYDDAVELFENEEVEVIVADEIIEVVEDDEWY